MPDSSADKRGLKSSGRKRQSTRHADRPAPATSPVAGAFGKEGGPGVPSAPARRRRERREPESATREPESEAEER